MGTVSTSARTIEMLPLLRSLSISDVAWCLVCVHKWCDAGEGVSEGGSEGVRNSVSPPPPAQLLVPVQFGFGGVAGVAPSSAVAPARPVSCPNQHMRSIGASPLANRPSSVDAYGGPGVGGRVTPANEAEAAATMAALAGAF